MQGLIRIWYIEAENRRNKDRIVVELWAHDWEEVLIRVKPYAAKELRCEEIDLLIREYQEKP